jgi:hypothetical protein
MENNNRGYGFDDLKDCPFFAQKMPWDEAFLRKKQFYKEYWYDLRGGTAGWPAWLPLSTNMAVENNAG